MTLSNSIIKKILLILWVIIILTINSKYQDFFQNSLSLITIFNFARYFLPIILFPLIFYLILRKINKIKIDLFLILLILFGCIQLISLLYNINLNFYNLHFESNIINLNYKTWNFENIILLSKYFYLILLFILFQSYSCDYKKIFFILLIIISIVTVFYFSILLKEFIFNESVFYFYGNKELLADSNNTFVMQTNPRVTGLGRNLVIILSVLFFIYNDLIIKKAAIFKTLFLFLIFLSTFLIWGTQSRGSLVCLAVIIIMFFLFDKKNIKYKILFSFLIFLIPILLFENISKLKYENYKSKYKLDNQNINNYSRIFNKETLPQFSDNNKETLPQFSDNEANYDYSTGRSTIWKRSFNFIYKKPWIGYGPQGDRVALSNNKEKSLAEQKHIWDNNSSNAVIYTLLSSGIFGLICLTGIYLLMIKKIVYLIFKSNIFYSNNYMLKINISIIPMLLVRSAFENGFVFFGIDLIFLITCFYYLKNNHA
jgi:O-antigen ligase